MSQPAQGFDTFLELSVKLTGFKRIELVATGVTDDYYEKLTDVVAEDILDRLWALTRKLVGENESDPDALEKAIRKDIWGDCCFGPIARSIVKLWYLATWYPLPSEWRQQYGSSPRDEMQVISPLAYKEGLVWPAIGAHPMGAKQPGFASWSIFPPSGPEQ